MCVTEAINESIPFSTFIPILKMMPIHAFAFIEKNEKKEEEEKNHQNNPEHNSMNENERRMNGSIQRLTILVLCRH